MNSKNKFFNSILKSVLTTVLLLALLAGTTLAGDSVKLDPAYSPAQIAETQAGSGNEKPANGEKITETQPGSDNEKTADGEKIAETQFGTDNVKPANGEKVEKDGNGAIEGEKANNVKSTDTEKPAETEQVQKAPESSTEVSENTDSEKVENTDTSEKPADSEIPKDTGTAEKPADNVKPSNAEKPAETEPGQTTTESSNAEAEVKTDNKELSDAADSEDSVNSEKESGNDKSTEEPADTKDADVPKENGGGNEAQKDDTAFKNVETRVTQKPYIMIGEKVVPLAATSVDISNINLKALGVDMEEVFGQLKFLQKITMVGCGLENAEYAALQDNHPEIRIIWEIDLGHWKLRTDAVGFSTLKTTGDNFYLMNEQAYYLKYCTDMVALDIGHNFVSDLSFIQYMPELKILILSDNYTMESMGMEHISDLSMLKYASKLRYLEVFNLAVSDFTFIRYLPDLEDLNISYTNAISIDPFMNLPNLQRLWMENTYISYNDYQRLVKKYPDATIVYFGEGSVDQGWRSGEHYEAMREMVKNNVIHPLYR